MSPATTSVSILCVDDEPDFADMTGTFLEKEDDRITVETATSASDGLDHLAENNIDCIVSDYDMPGMDGIEFLEIVRDEYPELPFIVFTAKGGEEIASDAVAEEATDYLQKHPGREQYELLANRIMNAVDQYRATQRAANLERIRRVIRDSNQALVRAKARDELEQRICEIISDADPYCFAWIGEVDTDDQTVEPRTAAGVGDGYLDTIQITFDERSTGQGPTGRAVRTRELVAVQNIPENAEYEPWREDALERGYRSSAAIPLVYDDTLYGVLNVYAARIDAFDEEERELLAELADNVAHASARLEAQAHQERLERIIDSLPVGVYRATSELDGEVVDANPALADMFDADSVDTLVGRQISDYYQHPEEWRKVSDQLLQGGSVQGEELRLETLEGADTWIELTAVRTEKDNKVQFGGIIEEITERKAQRQKLEQQNAELAELTDQLEDQYHRLFEEAPVMIVETRLEDGEPIIEDCNRRFVETLGHDGEEVLDRPLAEFYTANSRQQLLDEGGYERSLAGQFTREDRELVTTDGEAVETLLRAVPRYDIHGELVGTIAYYIDISERKELRRERDRLEEFSSIVSHDLRNPLNVAQGRLELARTECDSEHLDPATDAVDRSLSLIDDLLTMARKGKEVTDPEPVDLADVVGSCWQNVGTAEATLVVDTDRTIQGDRSRLAQLLENLIRNAVEHGGDGVTITVGDLEDGFYVADDGAGIPADERERIFEFGHSTSNEGTGFGLAIVREIAEAHGWNIRMTESETGGARFEMTDIRSPAE